VTHTPIRKFSAALLVGAAVLLSGCASGPIREWRDLEVTLPAGWSVGNETSNAIYLADGAMTGDPQDPGILEVGVQLSYEPRTTIADWRDFVRAQDGTIEEDEGLQVDGIPADRLVFSYVTGDTPMREMVVVVPSRGVVMLFQPAPLAGEQDGKERFTQRRDEFEQILGSIRFGAPVGYEP
jgi:hypothetical protein